MPRPVAALTAQQLRCYRILSTGLDRHAKTADDLDILQWGVQDTGPDAARLALANRLADPARLPEVGDPAARTSLALAWTWRGTPYLHRRADLPRMAAALWPVDSADAVNRMVGSGKGLRDAGVDPLEALRVVADAARRLITAPMTKGQVSAAVTADVPADYSSYCRPCATVHVREMLLRSAALPAGLGLVPATKPVELAPFVPTLPAPQGADGLARFADLALEIYGAASVAQLAALLGASSAGTRTALSDTVPVTVDGRRAVTSVDILDRIGKSDQAAARSLVRLLGPSDPFLAGRDRATLVEDSARRSAVWPVLGPPGVLLAGGEVAGIWRTRMSGSALTITLQPWVAPTRQTRSALEAEVDRVRIARRADRAELTVDA